MYTATTAISKEIYNYTSKLNQYSYHYFSCNIYLILSYTNPNQPCLFDFRQKWWNFKWIILIFINFGYIFIIVFIF
ncbi:MAG: hypothetical protein UR28_C0008G0002 [Candidatus Peregrinibacteria bacterium GW2011_GWF2_33_10]|nr:MAG: hypothetical protein UR28_C0008G0002 [Candidatus Peregrinibacteria bacterium GW2011_GWF2_33_10]